MILTKPAIRELTGRTRSDAQRRDLDRMGIRYLVRTDGSLVVTESEVARVMGTVVEREPELNL